jgi:hypothetical protein
MIPVGIGFWVQTIFECLVADSSTAAPGSSGCSGRWMGARREQGRSYVMVLGRSIPMTLYQYIKLYVFLPVKTPVKKIITPATQQLNILASPVGGRPAPDTVSRDGVVFP